MSAPVRFLALVVTGWAGIRAVTLGMVPGFTVSYANPMPRQVPPIVATQFPPLPPVEALVPSQWLQSPAGPPQPAPLQVQLQLPPGAYSPYPYALASAESAIPPRPQWQLPSSNSPEAPVFYSPLPKLDRWAASETLPPFLPQQRSAPVVLGQQSPQRPLDRVQLTSWAMLRGVSVPGSLASGGTLGGSQAGARLTYAFNRSLAASLRMTSPVGGSGTEVALGLRFAPFRSIPVAITAERRQALGRYGGRSDFALFLEGGVYGRPMPLNFDLDAYVQAGVVGLKSRDLFADGSLAFTRPIWGRFSAGFGFWGGVQPGLYRIDAGPRISIRLRDNLRAHLDWRQRLAGNARPASGPALTLAADF
ncbi:MAG TPA: hypothetical protein VFP53_08110 [Sphingomicrobium sp.]|nr:hypothetical protein [Sphingomicrobium sp.]